MLRFEVRDDGSGFDPDAAFDGTGLQNLRDRLDAFDGRLEIVSAPGRGTVIAGAVPVG
jgi:signal transduction histidine kinase